MIPTLPPRWGFCHRLRRAWPPSIVTASNRCLLHVAQSVAVPTYHIRPMGETAPFREGRQRATRPSGSRVSSSDGTAWCQSLAAQARPVKLYHTTIHPAGACCRCKKATIVAELTHSFRRRHHGHRPFPDQDCIDFPSVGLPPATPLRPCRHRRATPGPLHLPPPAFSGRRPFESLPGNGSSNSSDPRQKAPERTARSGMVTGWPESPWAESPAGALIRNRLTARPARPISRHRPSTRALSAPAQPESVTLAFTGGARGTDPCPVTGYDVAAISHGLARAALAIHTSGGATRLHPRRAPSIHRRKGSMDADAGRATTRTCRGHSHRRGGPPFRVSWASIRRPQRPGPCAACVRRRTHQPPPGHRWPPLPFV